MFVPSRFGYQHVGIQNVSEKARKNIVMVDAGPKDPRWLTYISQDIHTSGL